VSTIHSPFSSQLIASNSFSILTVFCQCFTWIALGDVDLHFSLIVLANVNAVEEETIEIKYIHNVTKYIYITHVFRLKYFSIVGNSISKLQIQVANHVFELSAGNCHR